MSIFAVRDTLWKNLSVRNNTIVAVSDLFVDLGVPAKWMEPPDPPGFVWNLFCDARFTVEGAAYLGAVMGNLGRIGAQYKLPYGTYVDEDGVEQQGALLREQMREEVKAALGSRLTVPADIPEGEHPLNYALKQNNNSPQLMFFDEPPAGWEPVEVTP